MLTYIHVCNLLPLDQRIWYKILIYYLIAINYIATPELILNVPNQTFNEINGIRQFKLSKVPTSNLTRKSDRDTLERFIRASFPLSVGTVLRPITKMRKIRVRKKIITTFFKKTNVLCVLKLKWFNFMLSFAQPMLKRFNKVQFVKWLSNKIWLESHKFFYVSCQLSPQVFPITSLICKLKIRM